MRQVLVGIREDGAPFCGFRDGWDMDVERFVDQGEQWTIALVDPETRLAEHITAWYELQAKAQAAKALENATDFPVDLGRPITVDDFKIDIRQGPPIVLAQRELIGQNKDLYFHWIEMLQLLARTAKDDELDIFILAITESRGTLEAELKQKAKTSARHRKGVTTKEKIKLRKPWTKHIIAGYERAKKKHAARVHGDSPIELFWNDVICYANDERTADETIRFYGDDRLFDDEGSEISSLPWDVHWTTARNEVGRLKKKGSIKK